MDWLTLRETLPKIKELPDRAFRMTALERVLDGTHYDELPNPFSREKAENGEYIPLRQRRPSVRTNLCRVVVEDAVSLLFSEGHWPPIRAKSDDTMKKLNHMVKVTQLNEVMLEAATRGSVGSVVIHMRILDRRPFFDVMATAYLTPSWLDNDPKKLKSVSELYQVKGRDLAESGYPIADDDLNLTFWFHRVWDDDREIWYLPVKVGVETRKTKDIHWVEDASRTVRHALGFVPMVWVRNLPTSRRVGSFDGGCTFEAAIDTVIEADYLMSQGGRALKYASDPTLVIKQGTLGDSDTSRVGGSSNALELDTEGDAKLLEINGTAATAVREHVVSLRGIALEAIHGNRANADRLSAATSGRSIELMMSGLIALADRLRISYGEGGLVSLLLMICEASCVVQGGLMFGDMPAENLDATKLELRWPSWLPSMPRDVLEGAQALVTAFVEGIVSRETAVARFGSLINVDDAGEEFDRVMADILEQRAEDDRVAKRDSDLTTASGAAVAGARASTARNAATVGTKTTSKVTA